MPITGTSTVCAVIGDPIAQTSSPNMHNAAYADLGLDMVYTAFHVKPDHLEAAVKGIRALNIRGINVTIPHKEAIMAYLDEIDPKAKAIGAVNTVVNEGQKLIGYNTDGDGFVLGLRKDLNFDPTDKRIVILGAGGSAKSVAYSLLNHQCQKLSIINRNLARAKTLAESMPTYDIETLALADETQVQDRLQNADLVINTTPVGMSPNTQESPIQNYDWVSPTQTVVDIIYKPAETQFLAACKAKGANTTNGAGMLAGQGVIAFTYFTGQAGDYTLFKKAINS